MVKSNKTNKVTKVTHERTVIGADDGVIQAEPVLGTLELTVDGVAVDATVGMGHRRRDGMDTAVVDSPILTVVNQELELATASPQLDGRKLQTSQAPVPVALDDSIGHIPSQGLTVGLDDLALLGVPLIGAGIHGGRGPEHLGLPISEVPLLIGQPQGHKTDEAMIVLTSDAGQRSGLLNLARHRRLVLEGLSTTQRITGGPEGLRATAKDKNFKFRVLVPEAGSDILHLSMDRAGEVSSGVTVGNNVTRSSPTGALGAAEPADVIQKSKENHNGPVNFRDAQQVRELSEETSIDATLGGAGEEE